jgi:FkbM family methyltransferase
MSRVMNILNNAFRSILFKASASGSFQNLLGKYVSFSQYLMGIGSGYGVSSSGEQAIFYVLKQRFKPPYCIFDVGSNKGQFLQLTLDKIGVDDFSIHCFEPGHEAFKILAKSFIKDNRIILNNIGIGKEKCEEILYFNNAGSSLASLTKRRLDHFGIYFDQSEAVQITTIDYYCSENAINHIHLLKMDIEGHELDALAGARTMFDKKLIDIATFEFGGCTIDTRTFFQDFWYFFSEINMDIFRITPTGYLFPITSYKEVYEQFRTTNFIAVSRS